MKKIINLLIVSIIIGLMSPILLFANDHIDSDILEGTVPPVASLTIQDGDITSVDDLNTSPANANFFKYTISHNSRSGWKVTFDSVKDGYMVLISDGDDVLTTSYGTHEGEKIEYKVTTQAVAGQGAAGSRHGYFASTTEANASTETNHNFDEVQLVGGGAAHVLSYDLLSAGEPGRKPSVTATNAFQYTVNVITEANGDLFHVQNTE